MIVIKIFGGLGNQMFQYAFSFGFHLQGKRVKYDLSAFVTSSFHNGLELENVFPAIKLQRANKRDMFYYVESYFDEHRQKQFRLKPSRYSFNETNGYEFTLIEDLYNFDDIYLTGYWQHAGYFEHCSEELMNAFSFKTIEVCDDHVNYLLASKIRHSNSVGVHVRRGDYLQSPMHRVLSMDYYDAAIEYIRSKVVNPLFFVFSDDQMFARDHFNGKDFVIVDNNKGISSYRDLQLMRMCKYKIIANSTFSWWAAWLNKNANKIVVTPEKWFTNGKNVSGLLLSEWIKM